MLSMAVIFSMFLLLLLVVLVPSAYIITEDDKIISNIFPPCYKYDEELYKTALKNLEGIHGNKARNNRYDNDEMMKQSTNCFSNLSKHANLVKIYWPIMKQLSLVIAVYETVMEKYTTFGIPWMQLYVEV